MEFSLIVSFLFLYLHVFICCRLVSTVLFIFESIHFAKFMQSSHSYCIGCLKRSSKRIETDPKPIGRCDVSNMGFVNILFSHFFYSIGFSSMKTVLNILFVCFNYTISVRSTCKVNIIEHAVFTIRSCLIL